MDSIEGLRRRLLFYSTVFALWVGAIFLHTADFNQLHNWIAGWRWWDGDWYQKIWSLGYSTDNRMLAFPPGYSYIVGSVHWLTGLSFGAAAILVNLPALFTGAVVMTETMRERFKIDYRPFFAFLISGPTLYYAFMIYSDALFFCLFSVSLALALKPKEKNEKKHCLWLGALLLLMPWVRITSYALVSWIVARKWMAVVLFVSLMGWLAFNWAITGDPLHFLRIQKAFTMPEGNFIDGFRYSFSGLLSMPESETNRQFWFQINVLPIMSMLALSLAALWFVAKREWVLALTIVSVMVLSRNQAFWRSVVRYDLPIYPLVALPLLVIASQGALTLLGRWRSKLVWVIFVLLICVNFWLQLFFARVAHSGEWTF